MQRASSICALVERAKKDATELRAAYEASLKEQVIRADLRIAVKSIFENLRSCLDYIAHDIFESHCATHPKPTRLYFPIRSAKPDFDACLTRDFPDLTQAAPALVAELERMQPYNDPWLGQFNALNNHNKHQDLAEQTRQEERRVTVSRDQGSVSWGPGVRFGSGVRVMGVPIDPSTQMPVPNKVTKTEVVTWVSFRFAEPSIDVLPFVEQSISAVEELFAKIEPHC